MPGACELVMPAGTLEKLETAVRFGSDAVYAAGPSFGLRASAGNLSPAEMERAVQTAHKKGVKVYITVNATAHNADLELLPAYLEQLAGLKVDGMIIADLGVLRLAGRYCPDLPVTISTQANVCNYESAQFFEDWGARRIVLARELTLDDIAAIRARVGLELEVFVHGAMCVAYSGRCLLSYYMTGRSANRGACAHPCRYRYKLVEEKRPNELFGVEEDEGGTYLLNSKDLCLLPALPELMAAGVNAFKVEGRMKSPLYVATVASIYRSAILACQSDPEKFEARLDSWVAGLQGVSPRPFTDGFLRGGDPEMNDFVKSQPAVHSDFCAMVKDPGNRQDCLVVEQRANFGPGESLEILQPSGEVLALIPDALYDQDGLPLDRARHPRQLISIPFNGTVEPGSIVRRTVNANAD